MNITSQKSRKVGTITPRSADGHMDSKVRSQSPTANQAQGPDLEPSPKAQAAQAGDLDPHPPGPGPSTAHREGGDLQGHACTLAPLSSGHRGDRCSASRDGPRQPWPGDPEAGTPGGWPSPAPHCEVWRRSLHPLQAAAVTPPPPTPPCWKTHHARLLVLQFQ